MLFLGYFLGEVLELLTALNKYLAFTEQSCMLITLVS